VGKLYLVRHAHAGSRGGEVPGLDEDRELSERGWRQAEAVCSELAPQKIGRLVSSPFRRCVQTLEPLAGKLGIPVEVDQRLAERATAADALALATEVRDTGAVFCSHGDVIPDLLEHLLAHGTKLDDELRWPKASTWVLTWEGAHLARGRYVAPPA
jgi:8-oxo-dGTP diphosphatase